MGNELLAFVREVVPESEGEEAKALLEKANSSLDTFSWAKVPRKFWIGECVQGVLGLFLVQLVGADREVDPYIWVVVGDLPPAYLSSKFVHSPREAVNAYIAEMEAWVDAVEKDKPTQGLIPVDGEPTHENAMALKSRLEFLDQKILPFVPGNDC
jgi:hypothetical protein